MDEWRCRGERKMGYLIISGRRQNWVKKTEVKGHSNINKMYQGRIIRMELYVTLKNERNEREEDM